MKNKNFLKKLTAGILGFAMTLGVGAAGYSASAAETHAEEELAFTIHCQQYTQDYSDNDNSVGNNIVEDDQKYVSSITGSKNNCGKFGIKLGSSSASGNVTLNIADAYQINCTKVVFTTTAYGTDSGTFTLKANSQSVSEKSAGEATVTFDSPTKLTSVYCGTSSKRGYLTQIDVYKEASGGGGGGGGGGETGAWNLVTDASTLKAGDTLVIASNSENKTAGDISSSLMAAVDSEFSDDSTSITKLGEGTVELKLGGSSGSWTLANSEGKLLGATAVKKVAWDNGTTTWSISITNNNATIQNGTSSYGRFLYNVGSPRFIPYTSNTSTSMLLPQLYRKADTSPKVTAVTLSEESITKQIGLDMTSVTLTATVTGTNLSDDDKTVTWSSDDESVATVVDGVVTFIGEGNCSITATSDLDGTKYASCSVEVLAASQEKVIILNADQDSYWSSDTFEISAQYSNLDNGLSIAPISGASIISNGAFGNNKYTGTFSGHGSVKFQGYDGSEAVGDSITISVGESKVTGVTLNQTSLNFVIGGATQTLTATVTDQGHNVDKTVTWTSSDESVATVNGGVVTPKGVGTATITASAGSSSASCSVEVEKPFAGKISASGLGSSTSITDNHNHSWTSNGDTGSYLNIGQNEFVKSTAAYQISNSKSLIVKAGAGKYGNGTFRLSFQAFSNASLSNPITDSYTVTPDTTGNKTYNFNSGNPISFTSSNFTDVYFKFWASNSGAIRFYSFEIEVPADLTSAEVKTTPKQEYATNDIFDPSNLVLTGTYEDETTKELAYKSGSTVDSNFKFYTDSEYKNEITAGTQLSTPTNQQTIYIKYGNISAGSYDISVTNHSITISGASEVLALGSTTFSSTDSDAVFSVDPSNAGSFNGSTFTASSFATDTEVTISASCAHGGTSNSLTLTIKSHTVTITDGDTTGTINTEINLSATDNGAKTGHNISWAGLDPNGQTITVLDGSFTPTVIGNYTITASCDCGGEDTVTVSVSYASIDHINIIYEDDNVTSGNIPEVVGNTLSGFSAVIYDGNGKINTVQQNVVWSVQTEISENEYTFVPLVPSVSVINTSRGGDIKLIATSVQDTTKTAYVTLSFSAASGEIVIDDSAKEVFLGESEKQITVSLENFDSPTFAWSSEDSSKVAIKQGEESFEVAHLVYTGVTSGTVITCVVSDQIVTSKTITLTQTIVVKASERVSFDLTKDGKVIADQSEYTIYDNGQALSFGYNIVVTEGYESTTAEWQLTDTDDVAEELSVVNGVATITSKNKIAADSTVTLTATTGIYNVVSKSVIVHISKSTMTVTLGDISLYTGCSGTLTANVTTTGNISDKSVTYALDSNNGDKNNKVTLNPSTGAISIASDYIFPEGSATDTINVIATSTYDGTSDNATVTITKSYVSNITLSQKSATIYEGQTYQISASISGYGEAEGSGFTYRAKTPSVATVSETGLITGVSTDGKDQKSTTIVVTSAYDSSKTAEFTINVKKDYIDEFVWNNGSNIECFAGSKLDASRWTFTTKWDSQTAAQRATKYLGDGEDDVHVYITDSSVEEEPTTLAKVVNNQILTMEDNGKSLVAFYKGVKCSTAFNISVTESLNKITVTESSTKTETKTQEFVPSNFPNGAVSATLNGITVTMESRNTSGSDGATKLKLLGGKSITTSTSDSTIKLKSVSFTGSGGTMTLQDGQTDKQIVYKNTNTKQHSMSKITVTYEKTTTTTTDVTYTNTDLTAQKAVVDFAKWFIANADSKTWTEIQSEYASKVTNKLSGNSLTYAQKMFKHAVHSGSDLDVLQQCVEKYDQLRYKNSSLTDFLNRGTQSVQFTVTLDKANGDPIEYIKVNAGGTYTLPEAPKNGSYDFQYWNVGGVHKNPNDTITVSDNVTVTAVYSEQIKMSTDIAFQFTGLTMTKGEVKFGVNFDETKEGLKEYGFLVTTNTSLDPTKLTEDDVLGVTPTGFNKVKNKETAVIASKNLELNIKVVFYYIDDTGYHYSEVITTSFKEIALTYDANNYKDEYARACFLVYQASIKDSAE